MREFCCQGTQRLLCLYIHAYIKQIEGPNGQSCFLRVVSLPDPFKCRTTSSGGQRGAVDAGAPDQDGRNSPGYIQLLIDDLIAELGAGIPRSGIPRQKGSFLGVE